MPKKQKAPDAAKPSADALSGTLEEYFATHRGSGEVSAHLLIGTPNHNAMASEPVDSDDGTKFSVSALKETTDVSAPSHERAQEQQDGGQTSDDMASQEDDEKPPDKSKADDTSVAGLTLGNYMNVADDKVESLSVKKKVEKKTVAGTQAKAKPKAKSGGAVVPGMSLDSYLGVAADGDGESDEYSDDDGHEESKASLASKKKAKKTLSPPKEGSKKPSKSKPLAPPPPPPSLAANDDSATPFQRHQKKKQCVKTKLQQQQQGVMMTGSGGAGPVSRSILMEEPLPNPSVHEAAKTNRKKPKATYQAQSNHHQHQLSPSQSPLPKLAASPLVAHTTGVADHSHFGPPSSITGATSVHHHGSSSNTDITSSTDKLPSL